jgi:GNAT superfamily N-acetyltransferase
MKTEIVEADLTRADHEAAVIALTTAYALDPMGQGEPLPDHVLERLVPGLRAHPTTLVLLAYADGKAVGLATCFGGFSTFSARPLINIHDFAVLPEFRGMGIGRALLAAVEERARARGCCKVTLEVQVGNARARHTYEAAGFAQATLENGGALFLVKALK